MSVDKEEKYMTLTGAIPGNKEIALDMRKDLNAFPGLRAKLLRKVSCKRCGWCCKTRVIVSKKNINNIRKFLKMGQDEFMSKYIETISGDYYLPNPCPFLGFKDDKAECAIYSVRPEICQEFPITFMVLTVGECKVGNELCAISEERFDKLARSLGIDPASPIFKPSDEFKEAGAKFEKFLVERQGDTYDPNNSTCKKLIVDRLWLQGVLDYINNSKEIKP